MGKPVFPGKRSPVELVTTHQPAFPLRGRVLGQWGPGFEVSRDGVEVATAAGSLARDSTSAISWSPSSLFLIRVVRRSDVKRNPALTANPIARPFSVLATNTAWCNRPESLDLRRFGPGATPPRYCALQVLPEGRGSSFNHFDGGDSYWLSITHR